MLTKRIDQVTVTGGGSANPPTVKLPGAYKSSDPGIQINIHAAISSYVIPGPEVYAGGTSITPGNPTCPAGSGSGASAPGGSASTLKTTVKGSSTAKPTAKPTKSVAL